MCSSTRTQFEKHTVLTGRLSEKLKKDDKGLSFVIFSIKLISRNILCFENMQDHFFTVIFTLLLTGLYFLSPAYFITALNVPFFFSFVILKVALPFELVFAV